jgi:hypothetical protein
MNRFLPLQSLVDRALADTARKREEHSERRPTWAPPIAFSTELIEAVDGLQELIPGRLISSPYGRLWAKWKNPKYTGGSLAGFDLRSGKKPKGELLAELRPARDSDWWVGPQWRAPDAPIAPSDPEWLNNEKLGKPIDVPGLKERNTG